MVESYRRDSDGMPMHRIVRSYGRVTELEAQNLKTTFDASKAKKKVVPEGAATLPARVRPKVVANRAWLDVVACLQTWRDGGLAAVTAAAMDKVRIAPAKAERPAVNASDVVAALVIQRCIEPASTLSSIAWFERTALPELLGIAKENFNNTRLHGVLEHLDDANGALQDALIQRFAPTRSGACSALFMDVTDTWFYGDGPSMATTGRTKEDMLRRKIGIVLLCDQRGMPLRFKVVEGNVDDGVAMLGLLRDCKNVARLGEVPLVCDRALGNTSDLRDMDDDGLLFVSSLVAQEHAAFGADVLCAALDDIDPNSDRAVEAAGIAMHHMGFVRHADDLHVRDLGVVIRGEAQRAKPAEVSSELRTPLDDCPDRAAATLRQARELRALLDSGDATTQKSLARKLNISPAHITRRLALLNLAADLVAEIDAGRAKHVSAGALARVIQASDESMQREIFAKELAKARPYTGPSRRGREKTPPAPLQVRVVVAFNAQVWQRQRQSADQADAAIRAKVRRLDESLREPGSVLSEDEVARQVEAMLKQDELRDLYRAQVKTDDFGKALSVTLERDSEVWQSRRRRDGIQVITASRHIAITPDDLVRLYRSKDQIEKDFQEIKSVLELRPLRHRNDDKVRAHVTLCILALAVERQIEAMLCKAETPMTAQRAMHTLKPALLNVLEMPGQPKSKGDKPQHQFLTVTKVPANVRGLSQALHIAWALDDDGLVAKLHTASS